MMPLLYSQSCSIYFIHIFQLCFCLVGAEYAKTPLCSQIDEILIEFLNPLLLTERELSQQCALNQLDKLKFVFTEEAQYVERLMKLRGRVKIEVMV